MVRVGFLINPIAGMGGRVGLKGTDDVVDEALRRGATPTAHLRAVETLDALARRLAQEPRPVEIRWLTCAGAMGADALEKAGFAMHETIHEPSPTTSAEDTKKAAAALVAAGVDLILFCGGDGTARDICAVTAQDTPILGIPAGVKMYSGVFGTSPRRTADIALAFLKGELKPAQVEVLDLDEDRYRRGEWAVRLYHTAVTPYEPTYTQSAKMLISESTDADMKQDIAAYLREEIQARPNVLFLLGPGSTVQSVADGLGIQKTLLGVDAVINGRLVGSDLNERRILELLDRYPDHVVILSPLGAQGFILGRGNLQLSPEVIRRIGTKNLIVVATPAKLARTPVLRVDTGDRPLDAELVAAHYLSVVVGYRRRRLVKTMI